MTKPTILLLLLALLACFIVTAGSWRPRTPSEKVARAELIVRGVATLDGLPLEQTEHPVRRVCRILVLETLWPTNNPIQKKLEVEHWAWTQWPATWWNYNSQTGIYFLERTTTALARARLRHERRFPGSPTLPDDLYGTNVWRPLSRFDDWYEPAANLAMVRALIKHQKNGP